MALNSDLQKLYVDGLITLFELDAQENWQASLSELGLSEILEDTTQ